MKLFKKLLAMILALGCVVAITACGETSEEELNTNLEGIAFEYKVEEADNNEGYIVITGLYLSDKEKDSLGKATFTASHDLKINKEEGIKVVARDKETNEVLYVDNKLDSKTIKVNDVVKEVKIIGFKIAESAFANHTIIKSVALDNTVVEIGAGAFAGCSNIETMELPFIGESADNNVNAKKTFGHLFGTVAADGCTSITSNYNSSSTATWYAPNALTEVTVNYTTENASLPEYAFNKVTTLEKVTVNGVVSIGKNAFEGCTSLYEVALPATATTIGKSAFSGCSKLINIDLSNVKVIYQSAFSGCAKLGYKATKALDLTGKTIYEGAFASCTSLESIKIDGLIDGFELTGAIFNGCSSLKTVNGIEYSEKAPEKGEGQEQQPKAWHFDDNGNIVLWKTQEETNN